MVSKSLQRHIVSCPHCGRDVLDHMIECPFCKNSLTPRGYDPRHATRYAGTRRIANIVGFIAAGVIIVILLVTKCA